MPGSARRVVILRRAPWAALVAAWLALPCGCQERPAAVAPTPVVIAIASPLHAGLVEVAAGQGLFAQEGLAVTVVARATGPLALADLREGRADLATCAETVVVLAGFQGHPVSLLAAIASSTRSTALVARYPSVADPAGLAGKRVGSPRGTTAEFFLDSLLLRHGVDRKSVGVVDLGPVAMVEALTRGEVDAVAIWEPFVTLLRDRLGPAVRVFHADEIHFETHDLVSRPGYAKERPAVVEKVLRALVRAEALLRDRPDLGRPAIRQALEAKSPGIDPSQADGMLALFDYRVRMDPGLLLLMEEEARWAIRTGLVPRQDTPNYLDTLEPGPLRAVSPGAVTLMR